MVFHVIFMSFIGMKIFFEFPRGAIHLMQSEICANQAFLYNKRVLGLQFHLEVTPETIHEMVNNCSDEFIVDEYVHTEEEILENTILCTQTNAYLNTLLNKLTTI